ncbi:MAG: hypothetical protein WBZ01_02995, partial [Terriglobales bacterium]
ICSGLYLWMGMTVFPPSGFSLIPPGTNLAGHVISYPGNRLTRFSRGGIVGEQMAKLRRAYGLTAFAP